MSDLFPNIQTKLNMSHALPSTILAIELRCWVCIELSMAKSMISDVYAPQTWQIQRIQVQSVQ
jgi:hypothetical protein